MGLTRARVPELEVPNATKLSTQLPLKKAWKVAPLVEHSKRQTLRGEHCSDVGHSRTKKCRRRRHSAGHEETELPFFHFAVGLGAGRRLQRDDERWPQPSTPLLLSWRQDVGER